MPNQLTLPSLEIRGYRGIRELKIERLGRANLIVGKNNVGKTSVLEAIRLYGQPGSRRDILAILSARDENIDVERDSIDDLHKPPFGLFERSSAHPTNLPPIKIGPIDQPQMRLSISFESHQVPATILEEQTARWINALGESIVERTYLRFYVGRSSRLVRVDNLPKRFVRRLTASRIGTSGPLDSERPLEFVSSTGLDRNHLANLWDRIVLKPVEIEIIKALQIFGIPIIRVVFVEDQNTRLRIPLVQIEGASGPFPLRSLGDGVVRMFGLAVALANSSNGYFLIDEIENGIHYSLQPDLWRVLFKLATKLNVQIFATTHSWDMVKAFQITSRESEEEGVLIRLAQKDGQTLVAEFDEGELETAVDGQIEVR
jgi:predicted ATPase